MLALKQLAADSGIDLAHNARILADSKQKLEKQQLQERIFAITPPGADSVKASPADVWYAGAVGLCTSSDHRKWVYRWAVLHRDRLDMYMRASDSKPKVSVNFEGCLLSTNTSPDGLGYLVLRETKTSSLSAEYVAIRPEPLVSGDLGGPSCPLSSDLLPDAPEVVEVKKLLLRAWTIALRLRILGADYTRRCNMAAVTSDARVHALLDTQVRHAAYAFYNCAFKFPYIPSFTLAGGPVDIDALSVIARVMGDVDALPVASLNLEQAALELIHVDVLVSSIAARTDAKVAGIQHLNLSGNAFLSKPPSSLPPTSSSSSSSSSFNSSSSSFTSPPALASAAASAAAVEERAQLLVKILTAPGFGALQAVGLARCYVTDALILALEKALVAKSADQFIISTSPTFSPLRRLDLSGNTLSSVGVSSMIRILGMSQSSAALAVLNLSDNRIDNEGAKALASWIRPRSAPSTATSSTSLSSSSSSPGAAAAAAAVAGEPAFPSLCLLHLDLSRNRVGDAGVVALARAIARQGVMVSLDLSGNVDIADDGAAALSHLAQVNESLQQLAFLHYRLSTQGLTAMRLLHKYGLCDPSVFADRTGETE